MRNARRGGLVAVALLVAAVSTACGSDDLDAGTDVDQPADQMTNAPMDEMDASDDPMDEDSSSTDGPDGMAAADELVGPGCAGYAEAVPTGEGSVDGMADDPVSVAASNNPILTTLVAAVSGGVNANVDLVSTLDGGEFTVFAPVDDAFADLDQATLDALAADDGTLLTTVLTYHVVAGRLGPADVVGTQTTVQGETVEITGGSTDEDALVVNGGAEVICGNVQTANATVYLIDSVLMPPSMM